jgi:FAD-dependent oxidoreductase domain-containing protein 1
VGAAGAATIVVGGGAIGSSAAYWLTRLAPSGPPVVVVERDPSYRIASTTLSAASIRQQFTTPLNVQLSRFGWQFLSACGADGDAGSVGLVENPYLFLGSAAASPLLRARATLARSLGHEVEEYDPAALAAAFPWLALDGVALGTRARRGEGCLDGALLLGWLRTRAIAGGARYLRGEVIDVELRGERVNAVRLADGTRLEAGCVIDAAGAWAAPVAALVGVELPIRARRRSAFVASCPTPLAAFPILIDTSGVFVRAEQRRFLCMVAPAPADDADDLPLEPDHRLFDDIIWPALAARVPAFEALRIEAAWAGYYEYSTFDQNGFVGRAGPANFVVAAGFSGHGLMHSPGVGRAVAELVAFGEYQTLDLAPLSPGRIGARRPIREDAVY